MYGAQHLTSRGELFAGQRFATRHLRLGDVAPHHSWRPLGLPGWWRAAVTTAAVTTTTTTTIVTTTTTIAAAITHPDALG